MPTTSLMYRKVVLLMNLILVRKQTPFMMLDHKCAVLSGLEEWLVHAFVLNGGRTKMKLLIFLVRCMWKITLIGKLAWRIISSGNLWWRLGRCRL